jgi:hypothetical protein
VPSHARFGFLNYHRAKWLLILPLGVQAAKESSDRIGFAGLCVVKDAPDYPQKKDAPDRLVQCIIFRARRRRETGRVGPGLDESATYVAPMLL